MNKYVYYVNLLLRAVMIVINIKFSPYTYIHEY